MISIIIPSFNEKSEITKTIGRLIDNISNSKVDIKFEIIVVDSSYDDTFDIIKASEYYNDDRCIFIHSNNQLYPGAARNLGIKKAKYNIIVFVDSGFLFKENWFIELVNPLIIDNSIDLVWGITKTSIVNKKDRLFAHLIESRKKDRRIIPNLAIRKKVFTEGHYFIENLRAVEDTKFISEIRNKYNEVFVDATNYYSGHPQSIKDAFKKWNSYSYYSYIAGYRKKTFLSISQILLYILLLIKFKINISILLIIFLQSIRVLLKSNRKYKINIWEFPYLLLLSISIDIGRVIGSLRGIYYKSLSEYCMF